MRAKETNKVEEEGREHAFLVHLNHYQ